MMMAMTVVFFVMQMLTDLDEILLRRTELTCTKRTSKDDDREDEADDGELPLFEDSVDLPRSSEPQAPLQHLVQRWKFKIPTERGERETNQFPLCVCVMTIRG